MVGRLCGNTEQARVTVIEAALAGATDAAGIDRKFDSLSITVEFFDLRIFSSGELLPANLYR